jgi:hypothetical protein
MRRFHTRLGAEDRSSSASGPLCDSGHTSCESRRATLNWWKVGFAGSCDCATILTISS